MSASAAAEPGGHASPVCLEDQHTAHRRWQTVVTEHKSRETSGKEKMRNTVSVEMGGYAAKAVGPTGGHRARIPPAESTQFTKSLHEQTWHHRLEQSCCASCNNTMTTQLATVFKKDTPADPINNNDSRYRSVGENATPAFCNSGAVFVNNTVCAHTQQKYVKAMKLATQRTTDSFVPHPARSA